MNLLFDPWVRVTCAGGASRLVSPVQITSAKVAPTDIAAPRPDLRAALSQVLVGLLQTFYAPADWRQWRDRWEVPPTQEELQDAFAPYAHAFELDNDGPAFMQDLDRLSSTEACGIAGLLIDAPGGNAVLLNKDLFIHRGTVRGMCAACAAAALFTLQINAPAGGAGHRVSLRGGGPLTTLRVPADPDASLWHRLWANVAPASELGLPPVSDLALVLPWLAPTRTSGPGGPGTTEPLPKIAHKLQAYWSMPRRIRLDFSDCTAGRCDLCGESVDRLLHRYRTLNYGVNYAGAWEHPLTPYNYDPKQNDLPISLKGQKGGIGYRQWAALALGSGTVKAAHVLRLFAAVDRRLPPSAQKARLWVCGLDMDNAKARCWYDATLPLYQIDPAQIDAFRFTVQDMVTVAEDAARALNRSVKEASTDRPADMESNPAVAQSFWQESERGFYATLRTAAERDLRDDATAAEVNKSWLLLVRRTALDLFDRWVLAVDIQNLDMRRVVDAKSNLLRNLGKGKAAELWKQIGAEDKATARKSNREKAA